MRWLSDAYLVVAVYRPAPAMVERLMRSLTGYEDFLATRGWLVRPTVRHQEMGAITDWMFWADMHAMQRAMVDTEAFPLWHLVVIGDDHRLVMGRRGRRLQHGSAPDAAAAIAYDATKGTWTTSWRAIPGAELTKVLSPEPEKAGAGF